MADQDQALKEVDNAATSKADGGGKNPLVTILLIMNAGLMGAVGFFQFKTHQQISSMPTIQDIVKAQQEAAVTDGAADSENADKKIQDDGILFPLETFTANLAQGDGPRRFLRLNAVLKFSKESKDEEFKARAPQIRDTVISILNSKRPEDLLKIEGKSYLKEEMKSAINSFLINGKVTDVYYVGFQIN